MGSIKYKECLVKVRGYYLKIGEDLKDFISVGILLSNWVLGKIQVHQLLKRFLYISVNIFMLGIIK